MWKKDFKWMIYLDSKNLESYQKHTKSFKGSKTKVLFAQKDLFVQLNFMSMMRKFSETEKLRRIVIYDYKNPFIKSPPSQIYNVIQNCLVDNVPQVVHLHKFWPEISEEYMLKEKNVQNKIK